MPMEFAGVNQIITSPEDQCPRASSTTSGIVYLRILVPYGHAKFTFNDRIRLKPRPIYDLASPTQFVPIFSRSM
jgi:hypothetical protein